MIRPSLVWAIDDASAAADAAWRDEDRARPWFHAVDDVARERLGRNHERHLRTLASRIAAQLPLAGLPRATALLERGCDEVRRSRAFARELAVVLLTSYVAHLGGGPPDHSRN